MTATTLSASDSSMPGLDRVALAFVLAFAASLQFSIAAANILLAAAFACWAALLVRERRWPAAPPFARPLAAYVGITLVSVLFSLDASVSIVDSRQLLLFLVVPLVYDLCRRERASTVVDVILAVGAANAAYGVIVQYGLQQSDGLGQRVQGALSHYMTYSGVLMLVLCAAAARLLFGLRDRTWPAVILPALVAAISLTLTRSAWVGMSVALGVLFALKSIRLTLLLPVLLVAAYVFAPAEISSRMRSTVDLTDPSNRDRVAMARAGLGMIRDYPLTGVGPDMVSRVYADYRPPQGVQRVNPHLHNVPLQVAAERGLPALAIWLWLIGAVVTALFRQFRTGRDRALAAAGLAAVAAMLSAGLFEYNFGDSEFLMLFLVLVTLPFAASRGDNAPAPARS